MSNKPDIQAIFDHYGLRILSRAGAWVKCECPMPDHEDNNPSASVNVDEGIFKCHACGARGDGYDIVEARERVDSGFAAVKRRAEEITGRCDSSLSREPASSSLLSGRPRRKRGSGNWVPPWSVL